jgi:AcrR family transcriptional regulator
LNATRQKLLSATADCLRETGMAGLSARVIASRAGVNQALVFYHFGTVADLVDAACRHAVDDSAEFYREQFTAVTSLSDLLAVGRSLHERERATGNVALMAQLMSGAQHDETLAAAARYSMNRWTAEIETVVARVLHGSPLADLVDSAGLARAISAGFIGLELYEGVDAPGAALAMDALEQLGQIVDVVDGLGPVARRVLSRRSSPSLTQRRRVGGKCGNDGEDLSGG